MSMLSIAILTVAFIALGVGTGCPDQSQRAIALTNPAPSEGHTLLSDVSFTRTGGLAAFNDYLEIGKDGTVRQTSTTGQSVTKALTPEEITVLAKLLYDSGLYDRDDRDQTFTSEGADLITYTVRYNGVTIRAAEDRVPDQLRAVLNRLLWIRNDPG